MDADGTRLLREADDAVLDLGWRDHHQVGELVDHDEDVRQRVLGTATFDARLVELDDVAAAGGAELLVAAFHLADHVHQGGGRALHVRHDGREQMRDRLVVVQLDPLRVDQDHLDLVRRGVQQDRDEHGVERAGLTGAGGAGDQHVRHLGEVGVHVVAADVLAEPDGQGAAAGRERALDVAERHEVRRRVRNLDADGLLAGDRGEDADVGRGECVGEVVLEGRDLADLGAGGELDLVARDARTRHGADHAALHTKALERLDERLAHAVERALLHLGGLRAAEHARVGQLVVLVLATHGRQGKVDRRLAALVVLEDALGRVGDGLLPRRLGRGLLLGLGGGDGHGRGLGRRERRVLRGLGLRGLIAPDLVDRVGVDDLLGLVCQRHDVLLARAARLAVLDQGLALGLFLSEGTAGGAIVEPLDGDRVDVDGRLPERLPQHAQLLASNQNYARHGEHDDQQQHAGIAGGRAEQLVEVATDEAAGVLRQSAGGLVVRQGEQERQQDQRHAGQAAAQPGAEVLLQDQRATPDEDHGQEDREGAERHARAVLQLRADGRAVDTDPKQQREEETEQREAEPSDEARQRTRLRALARGRLARSGLSSSRLALGRSLSGGLLRGRFGRSRTCGHAWGFSPPRGSPSRFLASIRQPGPTL